MNARKLELLSPAKNVETGIAAITAGADAVYIGGPSFGARSAAGNSIEEISKLCSFAHRFGAHVYLTVNTLLYDHELKDVEALIGKARLAGVDGIIVQDPAILSMATVRDLELHCSTQMNIDTVDKALFAQKLGFSQIVVPREFSLDEIKAFTTALPDLRFEVFVSGAMCVSVSGICYISELMTDRSANRGSCAQICRLPMELYHHDKKAAKDSASVQDELIASGHLLSMKDNLRLHELEDLVEAGAASFKIEGRLKDRDYVVNQVAAFRERLDKIIIDSNGRYARASIGLSKRTFIPDVTKTFNRGFTSAFVRGDNSDMVNTTTPKNLGELMGNVIYCGPASTMTAQASQSKDKHSATRADRSRPQGHEVGRAMRDNRGAGSYVKGRNDRAFGNDRSFTKRDERYAKGFHDRSQGHLGKDRRAADSMGAKDRAQGFVVDMKLTRNCILNNGDSYTYFNADHELAGFRVNRASILRAATVNTAANTSSKSSSANSTIDASKGEVIGTLKLAEGSLQARAGDSVRLHVQALPEGLVHGAALHRNVDTLFIKAINMPKAIMRKSALSCVVDIEPTKLTISFMDEYHRTGSASASYEQIMTDLKAANPDFDASALQPLKSEVMISKLLKLGDDYLSLAQEDVSINGDESHAKLSLSTFNNLRREALNDYIQVIELPRCECKSRDIPFLDGLSEKLVYTDPQHLSELHQHSGLSTLSSTVSTADTDSARLSQNNCGASAQSTDTMIASNDSNASDVEVNTAATRAECNMSASSGAASRVAESTPLIFPEGSIDPRLISNERSRAFYQQYMQGGLEPPNRLVGNAVMTCRNCLIKNHALCHEQGGSTTGFYLQIGKHRFDIVTNCKRCLMYLVPHEQA